MRVRIQESLQRVIKWAVLGFIIAAAVGLGFAIGGAKTTDEFDKKYRAVIEEIERIDRGECEKPEESSAIKPSKPVERKISIKSWSMPS